MTWDGYFAAQGDRPPRDLLVRAMHAAGPGAGRQAVEIGCGAGIEVLALLEAGWRVHATDGDPGTVERVLARTGDRWGDRLTLDVRDFSQPPALPRTDLLFSGWTLPFAAPDRFPELWSAIRESLRPGAVLAVNLFGDRDSWAGQLDGTFVTEERARELVDGLELLSFEEEDDDGESFSGPKHWHLFHLIARQP